MGGRPNGAERTAAGATQRQWVKFTFFKVDAEWRRLVPETRERAREDLAATVESFGDRMLVRSYSLSGLRGDTDFLIWLVSDNLDDFQKFATAVFSTSMGPHLSVAYSYLAMTRRSIYRTPSESQVDGRLRVQPGEAKYLFVYPFVKTRPWYALPKDERQRMMDDHIAIGKKYPSVKLNTTYSYGIDDQEFVVSFETDSAADFLDLVMELRETESSSYTLRDTPTFTCVWMPVRDVLRTIGAPGDQPRVESPAPGANGADRWMPVATLAEVPEGASTVIHFRGEQVALFNIGGRVYAISNRCPHANGPLAEGRIEGATVTCPWHDSRFDLVTGELLRAPAQRPAQAYDVKLEGETIAIAPRDTVDAVAH